MTERMKQLRKMFLTLNSTYDVELMQEIQEAFEKYLKTDEDSEFKTLDNTIHLLKGLINYEETNNIKSSYELILPMLYNLEFGKNIERLKFNYNRKLLIFSISICNDYRQSLGILNAIENSLELYPEGKEAEEGFKRDMYIRITNRLLHAKGLEKLSKNELIEVEALFKKYVKKAKILCVDEEYFNCLSILIAREGLFNGKKETMETGTYMARALRESRLQAYLDKSLCEYRALPTLIDEPLTEKEKFGIMLRDLRLGRKLSIGEFAGMISLSPGTIRAFEYGMDFPRLPTLERICEAFDITEDYFKQDISIVYKKATE
ncbi:MAG: helix-turn-helix domain-containing protein [Defluviitaleaceae bacterium]|nr:helix-turn-helix domain-containing protein [Defluviitaleaceae bacterium]